MPAQNRTKATIRPVVKIAAFRRRGEGNLKTSGRVANKRNRCSVFPAIVSVRDVPGTLKAI